jgi:hypothetical protein
MLEALKQLFRSRYVTSLEADNARLRQENRALLNSLLATTGHAPLDEPAKHASAPMPRRQSWHQLQRRTEVESFQRMTKNTEKTAS